MSNTPQFCTMDFPNCCSGGATFTACMLAQKVYIVHVFFFSRIPIHFTPLHLCVCMWVGVCVCACRYHLTHECTWNTWKFCIFFPFCFCQMAEFPASRGVEPFLGAALDQPWGCGKWKYGCCLLQHLQPIPRRWIYITYRILQRVFVHQKKNGENQMEIWDMYRYALSIHLGWGPSSSWEGFPLCQSCLPPAKATTPREKLKPLIGLDGEYD